MFSLKVRVVHFLVEGVWREIVFLEVFLEGGVGDVMDAKSLRSSALLQRLGACILRQQGFGGFGYGDS